MTKAWLPRILRPEDLPLPGARFGMQLHVPVSVSPCPQPQMQHLPSLNSFELSCSIVFAGLHNNGLASSNGRHDYGRHYRPRRPRPEAIQMLELRQDLPAQRTLHPP